MNNSNLFLGNDFGFGLTSGELCLGGGLSLSSVAEVEEGTPVLKEDGTVALTESGSAWLKE